MRVVPSRVATAPMSPAAAGLGFAADALKDQPDMLLRLVVVVASTLLLFGLGTLRRVMQRNIATTEHLNGLRVIRASYLVRQPSLISVMPFIPGLSPLTRKRKKNDWGLAKAGFLETVALANAALAGLAAAAAGFAQQQPTATSVTIGSAAALIAWMLQIRWAERVYEKEQAREAEDRFSAVRWWRRNLGEKANRGGTG